MQSRGSIVFLLVLLGLAGSVRPEEKKDAERLKALAKRFRTLDTRKIGYLPTKASKLNLLRKVAAIGSEAAFDYLADLERNPRYVELRPEILGLLAREGSDSASAAAVFRQRLGSTDPFRLLARDFLLRRAVAKKDERWLDGLFRAGPVQDRFLAFKALGEIGAVSALPYAWTLLRDKSWKVVPGTAVHCGTIAHAVKNFEGAEAARLLLLLARDPRFRPEDRAVLRDTTRLWATGNLYRYVKISDLAHPDAGRRAGSARFMGEAGIEAARAPLLAMASNPREEAKVRAAAADALGGLRIARGALTRRLLELVADKDPIVRRGALAGLARLRVHRAAAALVGMIDGPHRLEARAALAAEYGRKKETDWKSWLRESRLPEGA